MLNEKQDKLLKKEFKVNEQFYITRGDYESMPIPMIAWNWSDERMEELASRITKQLAPIDSFDETDERSLQDAIEDDFWKTMEDEAVRMGMAYYEDLNEEERESMERQWNEVK